MKYFPLFTDIKNQPIILCGGGHHAWEKLVRLQPFGANIHVISEDISEKIKAFQGITVSKRSFAENDLCMHPLFVIAAERVEENIRIAELCRRHHVLVNAVDMPSYCDFIFPSIIQSEQLCIGISTGGTSPTSGILLKEQIAAQIPPHIDDILVWMMEIREVIKQNIPKENQKQILRKLAEQAFLADRPLKQRETEEIIKDYSKGI